MKKIICLVTLFVNTIVFAQEVESIKSNPIYLSGSGKGITLTEADRNALSDLISQISTQVFSQTSQEVEDIETTNYAIFKKEFFSTIETYSLATLNNTKRIIISNEPEAEVLRYVHKEEVIKIFEARKRKIIDFYFNSIQSKNDLRIADAIKYAYWGNVLLNSHPYSHEIFVDVEGGQKVFLNTKFQVLLNEYFQNLDVEISDIEKDGNFENIKLNIYFEETPVVNLDYKYWDGVDWSPVYSAKDGTGIIELTGVSTQIENLKIKIEYEFLHEVRIDKEVESVLKVSKPIPFPKAYLSVKKETHNKKENQLVKLEKAKILKSFTTQDFNAFSENGKKVYNMLFAYGNAKLISDINVQKYVYDGKTFYRGLEYLFSFSGNKKFIESLVLEINKDGKIDNINFSLSEMALKSINEKPWDESFKNNIIHFLESYKTAYALKRLDYIESIFADDAVIITGYLLQVNPVADLYLSNEIVKYNKYSKEEFLEKLDYSFRSKEFINLKFEESTVLQSGLNKNQFGIQIKQNYFSSNYGDQGYLFLLVEFDKNKMPTIHVRTWQPEKSKDGSIYGLGDF